ncbi:creatininase family protein [Devosia sp. ZB163]|uniref:creatininase family protein n=1 Tax=Devosia sp. ZB163 TaxID=3025938 RepID=UPI0023607851|nr:creatininase family protein [Devosia sp. ZB163]MDC9822674.1 creatininase family protein [Devosia sp. ZB163]
MMLDAASASWEDVATAIARGLIAVLPVGAVEQHGPHLPLLTDTVMAAGVARRIAEGCDGFLLPALAYGDAWTAEDWAGTLSLSPDTLRRSVEDIGRGLQRMGVRGLVTVNGHFGNREPINLAARVLSEAGFPVLHLDYPRLEALAGELMDSKPAGPGFYHADEVETSIMLALAPETVRMYRAAPEYPEFPELFGAEPMKLSAFNRSGVFGDPRPATADKGEAMIAGIAAESLRLIGVWRDKWGI